MKAAETIAQPASAKDRVRGLESRTNQDRLARIVVYIIITLVAVAYVFPLYWMVATALKTDVEVFRVPPSLLPENPQWQNFPLSTTYIPFWQYMWNTMVISALTILGVVVSSAFIAYGFARVRWPGRNLVFMVYLSTIMLPAQVTLIPLYIIFRQFG